VVHHSIDQFGYRHTDGTGDLDQIINRLYIRIILGQIQDGVSLNNAHPGTLTGLVKLDQFHNSDSWETGKKKSERSGSMFHSFA
jgi:hypothetical protein